MRIANFDPKDIINSKIGLLTIKKLSKTVAKKYKTSNTLAKHTREFTQNRYFYLCLCECGNKKEIRRENLMTKGHTRSCGCLKNIFGKNNKGWTGFGDISGGWWKSIIGKAKYRNLDFFITIEDGWKLFQKQNGLCALTNLPLNLTKTKNGDYVRTASLDRINNDKGYIKGNVQWVHKDINWMKGTFTQTQFIKLCKLVTIKMK